MNFSFTMNSSVSTTSDVYLAHALETCDFFPRSGGGGGNITSWRICCPILPFSPTSDCMMPPEPPLKEKPPSYAPRCMNGLVKEKKTSEGLWPWLH